MEDRSAIAAMALDDVSSLSSPLSSVPSSPLTEFSRSPSPAFDPAFLPQIRRRADIDHLSSYPSPPSSQQTSQSGSPTPDGMDAANKDEQRPTKRRRVSTKERTTEYLDLSSGTLDEEEQVQFERVMNVLHKSQKIVVVAGAGISVSAGIPDFRSSGGLFRSLKGDYKIKGSGKDLFDASVYQDDKSTTSFHHMVSKMSRLTKHAKPTVFHHMLATIAQEDRLLRLYSQNVDGIDTSLEPLQTAIPLRKDVDGKWPRTVQLHGGLGKMVCSKCHDLTDFNPSLFEGPVPPACPRCEEIDAIRTTHEGKRSHGIGKLRPRMVLYNEHNPDDEAIGMVTKEDLRRRPDAVIVVGTTLKIPGVRRIVREMCGIVRDRRVGTTIWLNNDPPPPSKELEDCWDIVIKGTSDAVAKHAAMRQWNDSPDSYAEISNDKAKKAAENTGCVHVHRPAARKEWPVLPFDHLKAEPLLSLAHRNNSFRPPSPNKRASLPMEHGPQDWSPIAARRHSVLPSIETRSGEDDIERLHDEEALATIGLLTPTKSSRNSPAKLQSTAFSKLSNPAAQAQQRKGKSAKSAAQPIKKSNVKFIKPNKQQQASRTASKVKPTSKTQTSSTKSTLLTNTFKQSKVGVQASKMSKLDSKQASGQKGQQMHPNLSLHDLPPQDLRNNTATSIASPSLSDDEIALTKKRLSIDSIVNQPMMDCA